jgi:hypothetical protein
MMDLIIKDKIVSFKYLEKNIFKYICQCGCEMACTILVFYSYCTGIELLISIIIFF